MVKKSLGRRLTLLIMAGVSVLMTVIVAFYAYEHRRFIDNRSRADALLLAESAVHGIVHFVRSGQMDIAQRFALRLQKDVGELKFRLIRPDGSEAFSDNATLYQVNERQGRQVFAPRVEATATAKLPADEQALSAFASDKPRIDEITIHDESHLRVLYPISTRPECQGCHGSAHTVLGVLELWVPHEKSRRVVLDTLRDAAWIAVLALVIVLVVLAFLIHRIILVRIVTSATLMERVAGGQLEHEIPVKGRDEMAIMAQCFNLMLNKVRASYEGLRQDRNKLETIVLSIRDGIVVTDSLGDVVLVNPSAARILGKTPEEIQGAGFSGLFDDPLRMSELLGAGRGGGATETFEYRDKVLAVSAVAITEEDGMVGRMALVRDVTEEKRLEAELWRLSNTDGLTGLANRRRLDEILASEFERSVRGDRNLSVILFDVDHFKRFNDTYGHDQGDRVLQAVAHRVEEKVRNIDVVCRYGGEEFMVILPETAQSGALVIAERVRQGIESMRVDTLQVTISLGVAGWAETGVKSPELLIQAADEALYAAKEAGRNRAMPSSWKNVGEDVE